MEENKVLSKTFLWLFMGLLVTGIVSWYTYSSKLYESLLTQGTFTVLLIVEVVAVVLLSFVLKKLSPTVVAILYFVYAVINGVTLSTIFLIFELNSIMYCLFATAAMFGIMGFIGYSTNINLGKFSTLAIGALIAGIIISIANLFLKNTMIDMIISWVVLVVCFGITAYDIQRIKQLEYSEAIPVEKLHIYGAMKIYLDFINIFIRILSLFGKKRN